MSLCRCGTDEGCPVHPESLTCELCHREEATHWTVEKRYDHCTGIGYYEAIPVCDNDTPRVASGDRPDDLIAVTQISLTAKAPWI